MNEEMKVYLLKALAFMSFLWFSFLIFSMNSKPVEAPPLPQIRIPNFSCLMIGHGRQCILESRPPDPNSRHIWAEFIGIGPARSGSSNLL